jgi:hypothetical protein
LEARIVILDPRTRVQSARGLIYTPVASVRTYGEAAPWGRPAFAPYIIKACACIGAAISRRAAAGIGLTALAAAAIALVVVDHRTTAPATHGVADLAARPHEQRIRFADRFLQAEVEIANQIAESTRTAGPLTRSVRTVRFMRPEPVIDSIANADSSEPLPISSETSSIYSLASVTSLGVDIAKGAPAILKYGEPGFDEVEQYLWEVYQREPVKKDGSGDFTWKDPAAAKRLNMSLQKYVISGVDPDFREQLYHAGRAMDAAGLNWSILSAFRDDYRQGIASGLKAGTKNSRHGGSVRTGGYGHGQAVDVTGTNGTTMEEVWRWFDAHGAKYGLHRPMPGYDPAHVQSRGDWRKLAQNLRRQRVELARRRERDEAARLKLASTTEK